MKVYFTFGQIHRHRVNGLLLDRDCVGVIYAHSHAAARVLAFEWFDGKFHNSYDDQEMPPGSDKFKHLMSFFPRGLVHINPPPKPTLWQRLVKWWHA